MICISGKYDLNSLCMVGYTKERESTYSRAYKLCDPILAPRSAVSIIRKANSLRAICSFGQFLFGRLTRYE